MSNKNEEKGYSKKEEWLLGTIDKVLSINNSSQYHKHLLDLIKIVLYLYWGRTNRDSSGDGKLNPHLPHGKKIRP